jgi:hypothetical protein
MGWIENGVGDGCVDGYREEPPAGIVQQGLLRLEKRRTPEDRRREAKEAAARWERMGRELRARDEQLKRDDPKFHAARAVSDAAREALLRERFPNYFRSFS